MRALRSLLLFKLGFWSGMTAAALFAKRALPSRGDEESDELGLVAIFDGIQLKSRSKAFTGGSMLAWWGGIAVDLREAELAPDARLYVRTLFGGIAIRTPPTWRVESKVTALFGGTEARTFAEHADAPVLTVEGMALFGGVAIGAKAEAEADEPMPQVAEPVGE
jgi:hypothetical protein